jgi:hypothetical protein
MVDTKLSQIEDINMDTVVSSGAPKVVLEVYRKLKKYGEDKGRIRWKNHRRANWRAIGENRTITDADKREMELLGLEPTEYNLMTKGVQGSSAIVINKKPTWVIRPKGSGDLWVADLLARGLDFVWEANNGDQTVYETVEERQASGMPWLKAEHNRSTGIFGSVEFRNMHNPEVVYYNPDSERADKRDSDLIIAIKRKMEYLRENYPNLKVSDLDFSEGPEERGLSGDEVDLDDYVEGEDNYTRGSDEPSIGDGAGGEDIEAWEIEAWMLRKSKEMWGVMLDAEGQPTPVHLKDVKPTDYSGAMQEMEAIVAQEMTKATAEQPQVNEQGQMVAPGYRPQYTGAVRPWPREMQRRELVIIVGKKIIPQWHDEKEQDTVMNPWGEDAHGYPVLPLIPIPGQRTRKAHHTAPSTIALPIQRSLNKREAQYLYAMTATLNSPLYHGAKTQLLDAQGNPANAATPGTRLVMGKDETISPGRVPPGTVDLSQVAMRIQEDKTHINEIYDMHDVMKGKSPGGPGVDPPSGKAILALQDFGTLMSSPFLWTVENGLAMLGKAILAMILITWPRSMWERLLEDEEMGEPPDGAKLPQELQARPNPDIPGDVIQPDKQQVANYSQQRYAAALDMISPPEGSDAEPIQMVDIDIQVAAGSSLPTNRMARLSTAIEMFKAGLYDHAAALEYADDPKAKEISERMKQAMEQQAAQQQAKG